VKNTTSESLSTCSEYEVVVLSFRYFWPKLLTLQGFVLGSLMNLICDYTNIYLAEHGFKKTAGKIWHEVPVMWCMNVMLLSTQCKSRNTASAFRSYEFMVFWGVPCNVLARSQWKIARLRLFASPYVLMCPLWNC
jgi:hypothetical protein